MVSRQRFVPGSAAMTVMVVLVRGINVGGKAKLAMADLREIAEGCGFEQVRTYIQSGNLVCSTSARSSEAVAATLQKALAEGTDLQPLVMARTRDELAAAINDNPFLQRGEDPAHLHVTFLATGEKASLGSLDLSAYAPEEAAAVGSQLYLFLPNGMGRSKLAVDLGRRKGPSGTARNWRTTAKLLEMADETT
jgi:uncharacterized protein (DUF1697 family)